MSATTSDTATEVLASPFTINTLTIKNRIVLGPMAVLRPTEDGRPSEQTIAFLTRRARGGAGLIIVGGSVASDRAWSESPFFPNLRLDKDEFVADLTRLVDAVHAGRRAGVRPAVPELRPHGRAAERSAWISAASPKPVDFGSGGLPDHFYVPGGRVTPVPHEATVEEIKDLERDVVASRAPGEGGRLRRRRDRRAHVLLLLVLSLAAGEPAHRRVRRIRREPGPSVAGRGRSGPRRGRPGLPGGHPDERERPHARRPGAGRVRRGGRAHRCGRRGLHLAQRGQLRVDGGERAVDIGQHAGARRAAGVPCGGRRRRPAVPLQHAGPAAGGRRRSRPGTPMRRCSPGRCSPTPTIRRR